MKKLLIAILLLLVLLVGGFVGGSFFLPDRWEATASRTIDEPAAKLYTLVADLETWKDWTAWNNEADPTAQWNYEGPDLGKGATMTWQGDSMGNGRLVIDEASPESGIRYTMTMEGMTVTGSVAFEIVDADTTKVTWHDEGNVDGIVERWIGLALGPMLTSYFEANLAGLENAAGAIAPAAGGTPVEASGGR